LLVIGTLFGNGFLDMLRLSIVLAITAVPEGLLIAVTVILVIGMRRIFKRHGLVKKLLAVETSDRLRSFVRQNRNSYRRPHAVNQVDLLDQQRAWQAMVLCKQP